MALKPGLMLELNDDVLAMRNDDATTRMTTTSLSPRFIGVEQGPHRLRPGGQTRSVGITYILTR